MATQSAPAAQTEADATARQQGIADAVKNFLLKAPLVDHLNPKNNKAALAELRSLQPPTEAELQAGWAEHGTLFEKVERRLRALTEEFNNQVVPPNIQRIMAARCSRTIATGEAIQQGTSNATRLSVAIIQSLSVSGSQALTSTSRERAYHPRQSGANALSIPIIIAEHLSGVTDARAFYTTLAMRYGISTATYILAIIQLFLDLSELGTLAKIAVRAGTIIGNLLAFCFFFLAPRLPERRDTKAVKKFAASVPSEPGSDLYDFARRLYATAEALETLSEALDRVVESSPPMNATAKMIKRYRTELGLAIADCKAIASNTLSEEERDRLLPPPNAKGAKTPQIGTANAILAANLSTTGPSPQNMADYAVWGVFINYLLFEARENPFEDPAGATETFVSNGAGMFFALLAVTSVLLAKRDPEFFNRHPTAVHFSTASMVFANLFLGNLLLPTVEGGISLAGWLRDRRRRASEDATSQVEMDAYARTAFELAALLSGNDNDEEEEDDDPSQLEVDLWIERAIEELPDNATAKDMWQKITDKMEERRKAAEAEDKAEAEMEEISVNFVDLLSIADLTADSKVATKDVIGLFEAAVTSGGSSDGLVPFLEKILCLD